ncbi:MAG: hypothetical protein J6Y80_03055, partial [Victivallales bacterium]|nr:hypothetical protein [Victivallales bacterium]
NELSNLLAQLGLDVVSRHADQMRADNPNFKDVDVELRNEINEMRQLCDRRATEINHLALQMRNFSLDLASKGQNADPNIEAILKAKVNELLPRQALAMHGTADALTTLKDEVRGKLRPLADRIDAFRANPTATLDGETLLSLQNDIKMMRTAVEDIRKNGIEVGNGKMMVPRDIMKALEEEVAKAEKAFKTAKKDVVATLRRNVLGTAAGLLSMGEKREKDLVDPFAGDKTSLKALFKARDEYLQALMTCVNKANAGEDTSQAMEEAAKAGKKLLECSWNIKEEDKSSKYESFFDTFFTNVQHNYVFLSQLKRLEEALKNDDRFFTGAEAMSIFKGKLSVSSVVEARTRGLQDSDVDPANEDSNIVSWRQLGGGRTDVFDLKRRDGTSVVFKGEARSRTGLAGTKVGGGNAYSALQQTVNLNIASKHAADSLGAGDLIVKYSAGVRKGVFGFYMEKAKGFSAAECKHKSSTAPEDGLSAQEVRDLPPDERARIKGELRRQLNRLQWTDLVTGQMDRNSHNYFVHVDRATHKVTVKAIDNDASFSQYRVGVNKYEFDKFQSKRFLDELRAIATKVDSSHANDVYEKLLKDPAITQGQDGTVAVDLSKTQSPAIAAALQALLGVYNLAAPDHIDREMYDSLMALRDNPEKRKNYLDGLQGRLESETARKAAERRLDDAIAHAERLHKENKVVETDAWANIEDVPLETSRIKVPNIKGEEKRIDFELSLVTRKALCPSIFVRDGL